MDKKYVYVVVDRDYDGTLGHFTTQDAAWRYREAWIADHPGVWGMDSGLTIERQPLDPTYGEDH